MAKNEYPPGKHPNSIAALEKHKNPPWTKEEAREAQKKGAETQRRRAAERKMLKESMLAWKGYEDDILNSTSLSAVDTLRVLMHKALKDEDYDTAADLAKSIAEFEQPKLARIEQTNKEIKADELTDEELNKRLQELKDTQWQG